MKRLLFALMCYPLAGLAATPPTAPSPVSPWARGSAIGATTVSNLLYQATNTASVMASEAFNQATNTASVMASNAIYQATNVASAMASEAIDRAVESIVGTVTNPLIVLVPDSQNIVAGGNTARWVQTLEWCNTNSSVVAVVGLGDVVEAVGDAAGWTRAMSGLNAMTNKPILVGAGNHDANANQPRTWTTFNSYITRDFYQSKSWWTGGFRSSGQEDAYITVTNGLAKLLLITVAWSPTATQLTWVSNTCASFPDHLAIVATHSYLHSDGTRSRPGDLYTAASYGITDGLDGEHMWEAHLKHIPNLAVVASGHQICTPNEARSLAIGTQGNWVSQIFTDYQCATDGGGPVSMLKVLEFRPATREIVAKTFDAGNLAWKPEADYTLPLKGNGAVLAQPIEGGSGVALRTNRNTLVVESTTQDPDLLFHVAFEEGSGNVVRDSSPYSAWAKTAGGTSTWLTVTNALMGRSSFAFGTNNILPFTNSTSLAYPFSQIASNLTVSVWFAVREPHNYSTMRIIWGRHYGGTSGQVFVGYQRAGSAFNGSLIRHPGGGSDRVDLNAPAAWDTVTNGWHHGAITWDGVTARLYLDGAEVVATPFAGTSINHAHDAVIETIIGNYLSNGTDAWAANGLNLDEIKVWKRTLSVGEIWEMSRTKQPGYNQVVEARKIGINLAGDVAATPLHIKTSGTGYNDGLRMVDTSGYRWDILTAYGTFFIGCGGTTFFETYFADGMMKSLHASGGFTGANLIATNSIRLLSPTVPTTAGSAGTAGQISWDASYFYICVGANTWKRAALSTW